MKKALSVFHVAEKGSMNLGGTLMLGISMVFLAVGFIMFPNITTATDSILAYAYSANAAITDATYTGLTSIVGITPLLALLGYVAVAVLSGFMGIKMMKGGANVHMDPGGLLMLGIGLIFFAIGLLIFPVALDGISSVVHGDGSGISSSYTGLSSVILLVPMLLLLSYVAATVLSGYFGIKRLTSSTND